MLLDSFNFSFHNGLLSISQRNGVITLLPKKDKDLLQIINYRLISLLTVDNKIVAIVYCYLEFKLSYLKNLKLFSIRVKELSEPIVL